MSQLLLELFSEEIPSRMQMRAAEDFERMIVSGLKNAGLGIGRVKSLVTPRRLVIVINDVANSTPAVCYERKGPRVGSPDKAIDGFLRGAGLQSIDEADVISYPNKGEFYVAYIQKKGRSASEIIGEVVPEVCINFPWPKSMRWGGLNFNWIRPLHSILCVLGGEIVPFNVAGIRSSNVTRGHRFHSEKSLTVRNFEDYNYKLRTNKVILSFIERATIITEQARAIAIKIGLELVDDISLSYENAGLTEWPSVLVGTFDKTFLSLPEECLITSMRAHQKCFSLRDPRTGKLANKFIAVTNLVAADGGKQIIAGNERVIRARLSDAKFFWDNDINKSIENMSCRLDTVTFHQKLGSQKKRAERITELSVYLAPFVGAQVEDARRAAQLCKADLISEMVGEFPELQGIMGCYYARLVGVKSSISLAIADHYKPKGPTDTVPSEPVSVTIALAEKLDTLVSLWAAGEKTTGSGDPYKLRRAALGVIRLCLENDLRLELSVSIDQALKILKQQIGCDFNDLTSQLSGTSQNISSDLLSFFYGRLKNYLRGCGIRHDLIDAVFALRDQTDLALLVKRVVALNEFLLTDDSNKLVIGLKRAVNILEIEEEKEGCIYRGVSNCELYHNLEEQSLRYAVEKARLEIHAALSLENFGLAIRTLSDLLVPIDNFFNNVIINDENSALRSERLEILADIRNVIRSIADFSKVAG
ncbi:MAG: Glycine--tRNA ligase beta subunit [Hyphomicrobiaceae bacterium hypho_1]